VVRKVEKDELDLRALLYLDLLFFKKAKKITGMFEPPKLNPMKDPIFLKIHLSSKIFPLWNICTAMEQ